MDTYEKEIFDYLTKKENFNSAFEIYQQFPKVKDKLVEDFWSLVKSKLEGRIDSSDWEIGYSEDVFENDSKLGLKLKSYDETDIHIIFERLDRQTIYGVWVNQETNCLDKQKIWDHAKNVCAIKEMEYHWSEWWLGFNNTDLDFKNIESLRRILPDVREDLAQELAKILYDLAKEVEDDFEEMSKMTISVDLD